MHVALTGATGFIGSHVLTELREHGHDVTALVRNDDQAQVVAARGASPAVVDLYDRPTVVGRLRSADAAIHTASPGDATSADLDAAMVDAAIEAFAGTGKPYLHISGAWVYGANPAITEESPFDPPAMVSWREPIERRVLDASDMRGVVIVSSVAYGDGGGGVPGLLLGSPRDDAGNLIMLGTGRQRWSTVHVADLADFFRRALEDDSARGYYVIGDGENPTVAELTEAAAVAAGAPGAVPGSDDEARARLGDYFAEVLLLDQGADAAKARAELGWHPSRPGLVEEFRHGSYRNVTAVHEHSRHDDRGIREHAPRRRRPAGLRAGPALGVRPRPERAGLLRRPRRAEPLLGHRRHLPVGVPDDLGRRRPARRAAHHRSQHPARRR